MVPAYSGCEWIIDPGTLQHVMEMTGDVHQHLRLLFAVCGKTSQNTLFNKLYFPSFLNNFRVCFK